MVGFNNIGFDYPVIHHVHQGLCDVDSIYQKANQIIRSDDESRFANTVWENDWIVPQIDLYKVHHFDNKARATSLKVLEFNMRMENIEDLPFSPGTVLNEEQAQVLREYMWHDIEATRMFYEESKPQIKFREALTERYGKNFMNHNDTKIGKDYFIMRLEEVNPGCCYVRDASGRRHIVQTKRDNIVLSDVVLPYIQFEHSEFRRILNWFKQQKITETKGVFKDISCTIDGFTFDFGTGGIHGSVESTIVHSDDEYIIEDLDVSSYYPNLAIANKLSPLHLGETFCEVYKDVYNQRKQYAKGTPENAMLKLALNGVYGDSNNQYSPFYDPQYTMSITINGQLLLCLLAEKLMKLDSLKMIQINTDGLTVRYPRKYQQWVSEVCTWWEQLTGLTLESAEYSRMCIRDVNNYIAEYTDGKLKRKGAYEYELEWHQNHSALVVPKAAEAALIRGEDIREFILNHNDIYDFFLRTKVPRNSSLECGGKKVSNIVRYYISVDGMTLEKVMPAAGPLGQYKKANGVSQDAYDRWHAENGNVWNPEIHTKNKSTYAERRTGIHTGWTVSLCNNVPKQKWYGYVDLNHDWYIREAEKLVKPLLD